MNETEVRNLLEEMVDHSHVGLRNILSTLSLICTKKAYDAKVDLGDKAMAADWNRASAYMDTAKAKVRNNTAIQ